MNVAFGTGILPTAKLSIIAPASHSPCIKTTNGSPEKNEPIRPEPEPAWPTEGTAVSITHESKAEDHFIDHYL